MTKPQPNAVEQAELLAAETLTGDIRDFLLDRLKTFGKPWAAMTEDEQREQIIATKDTAEHMVREAVRIIAAEGRQVMVGNLDQVTIKDGIKAVITLGKADPYRHQLMDSQGQAVLIVVADSEPFTGERGPAEPIPDQHDLIASASKLKGDSDKVKPLRG